MCYSVPGFRISEPTPLTVKRNDSNFLPVHCYRTHRYCVCDRITFCIFTRVHRIVFLLLVFRCKIMFYVCRISRFHLVVGQGRH
jgi:hypothetical protein